MHKVLVASTHLLQLPDCCRRWRSRLDWLETDKRLAQEQLAELWALKWEECSVASYENEEDTNILVAPWLDIAYYILFFFSECSGRTIGFICFHGSSSWISEEASVKDTMTPSADAQGTCSLDSPASATRLLQEVEESPWLA